MLRFMISKTVKDVVHIKMKMTDVRQDIVDRQPQSLFTSVEWQNDAMQLNGD